jgi:circadian clock protein KaiC
MASTRVVTGIPGMDKLIGGGLPMNSVSLVSGAPGTGKSLLCLQYIYQGAKKGEPGIYVTFEQSEKDLLDNATKVGFKLSSLVKAGKIRILSLDLGTLERSMLDADDFITHVRDIVKEMKAKRLVIDSLSSSINIMMLGNLGKKMESDIVELGNTKLIPLVINEKPLVRTIVWSIVRGLKRTGCTCLITSETSSQSRWLSRDTISEFLADGVIILKKESVGRELNRSIIVEKMRNTALSGGTYSMDITSKGVSIEK